MLIRNLFRSNKIYLRHSRSVLLLLWLQALCFFCAAQQRTPSKVITSEFAEKEITFDKSSIISNVLKIKNNNGKPYKLRLQVSTPRGWKSIVDEDKIIEVFPS